MREVETRENGIQRAFLAKRKVDEVVFFGLSLISNDDRRELAVEMLNLIAPKSTISDYIVFEESDYTNADDFSDLNDCAVSVSNIIIVDEDLIFKLSNLLEVTEYEIKKMLGLME